MSRHFPILFALALSGVSVAMPARADNPCLALHELPVMQLPGIGSRKTSTIHRILKFPRDSHCSQVQGSGGQAVLIALPEPPLQVSIASIAKGKKGLVPVQVSVLGAERNALQNFRFSEFTQRGMRQSVSFHLNPANDPRYLLIETDLEQLGNSGSLVAGVGGTVVVAIPGFFGSFTHGSEEKMDFPYVDSGVVDVEFRRFYDRESPR